MNRQKRTELIKASALISQAQKIIANVRDKEQDAYDNLHENFQFSEQGQQMEQCISTLNRVYKICNDLMLLIYEM